MLDFSDHTSISILTLAADVPIPFYALFKIFFDKLLSVWPIGYSELRRKGHHYITRPTSNSLPVRMSKEKKKRRAARRQFIRSNECHFSTQGMREEEKKLHSRVETKSLSSSSFFFFDPFSSFLLAGWFISCQNR